LVFKLSAAEGSNAPLIVEDRVIGVLSVQSDELTEVTVYRVGRLGTFERQRLQLRPGTYTVVGSRRGYRDVRHTLVIVAGEIPNPLTVRCEERI